MSTESFVDVSAAPPSHTRIFELSTDGDREKWNYIVKIMTDPEGRQWFHTSLIDVGGVDYAEVKEWRINPEVAVVTRSNVDLDNLARRSNMKDLMKELMAFVPYSVVEGKDGYKLILPMGLSKTPGAVGIRDWKTSDHIEYYTPDNYPDKLKRFTQKFKEDTKAIRVGHVLQKLAGAIKGKHPKMALLTRFAKPGSLHYAQTPWASQGLKIWESIFPGTFRVGWKRYIQTFDPLPKLNKDIEDVTMLLEKNQGNRRYLRKLQRLTEKRGTTIKNLQINARLTVNPKEPTERTVISFENPYEIRETVHDCNDGSAPASYDPRAGGAEWISDPRGEKLTITNTKGGIIFEGSVEDIRPIRELRGAALTVPLGTIVCGWTE